MPESIKPQWNHVVSIRNLDGVIEVEWENPLRVIIHKDVRSEVRRVLISGGYSGDVTFEECPDDLDAIINYQAEFLNNFDLLLMASSRRPDLGDFPLLPSHIESRLLWNSVDLVMSEYGVTSEQIEALRQRECPEDLDGNPDYRNILFPLFRALRKRGFTASTLRG